jgi:hypothetical protein
VKWLPRARQRVRRWFGDTPGRWVPAGLFGGAAGACAAAWLLWGAVDLFGGFAGTVCFPLYLLGIALLYLIACVGGYSFISTLQHVVRAIQHLRRPPVYAYYEPPSESFPELEVIGGPHPGCGLLLWGPILLLGLAVSLPWFWFALHTVPPGRLVLALLLGLPPGLVIARRETRREAKRHKP